MLYIAVIAVCSEIHTKYINTLCGQNAASNHWPWQCAQLKFTTNTLVAVAAVCSVLSAEKDMWCVCVCVYVFVNI
jgi:hypothetical protein